MWELFDILTVTVRWVHSASAILWIGGSIFFLVVLRPAIRDSEKTGSTPNKLIASLATLHFREWVHLSMVALLVSGAILSFDRLTEPSISAVYIGALTAKIAIAFWLFGIGTATYRRKTIAKSDIGRQEDVETNNKLVKWLKPLISPPMIVYGGLIVILLSNLLNIAFEKVIR